MAVSCLPTPGLAEIVGVMDVDHERARRLADELSTAPFDSLDDLLNENPTAVYVTTPNSRLEEPVMGALKAGTHVFCEKPMATTLEQAKERLKTVEASELIYQIGFNRRFVSTSSPRLGSRRALSRSRPTSRWTVAS